MLRLLIRDITVAKGPEPKLLRLQIRWQGGATETIEVRQRPNRPEAVRYPDEFVAKIRALAELHDDHEIVAQLKSNGQTSSTGRPFTVSMISMDPLQASYHWPISSRRNVERQPGL
ncbi:hypothetical protein [Bradyrhizobium sp. RDI18]|uniref:hypothetical protein n=1 Tax=Bradyrhizobium sp. RDI18 TaxID=3367400 RepID=UPI0037109005